MIEVQRRSYKTDSVISSRLCYFLVSYTEVVYITYTMSTRDLPDIYALARGPRAYIYQANPEWPWYNYYIVLSQGLPPYCSNTSIITMVAFL